MDEEPIEPIEPVEPMMEEEEKMVEMEEGVTEDSKRRKCDEEKMEEILDIVPTVSAQDMSTREQDLIPYTDPDTGEEVMVAGLGSKTGEALFEQMEKIRSGLRMTPEEYTEYRKMWAKTTLREIGIAVPATDEDERNEEVNVVDGQLEEGGPTIRIKYILPDPRNPEHHAEFMRQKHSRMYARPCSTGIYAPRLASTAAAKGDRIPYGIDPVQYNLCYGIKNIKKLTVSGETLERLTPLVQQSIRDLLRNGCALPCVVKTPWLLRLFDHNPKPMTMSSVNVLTFYYILSSHILPTIFPAMGKASDRTKRLYEDKDTGITANSSRINDPENAYLREWSITKVVNYIKAYQLLPDYKKKTVRKLNHRMEMNDAKVRAWAYYQNDASYAQEMRNFFENVANLVLEYARHMEIDEGGLFEEGDSEMIQLMRFAKEASRNEIFLHDYWILLMDHMYKLITIQEMFILVQCYTVIPMTHFKRKENITIDVWGDLRTVPNLDPSKPFETTTVTLAQNLGVSPPSPEMHPTHIALFQSLELLERTMYGDYEREVWDQTKNIIGDYESMMGRDRDAFMAMKDTTPRLYGGSALITVPTMAQLQRSLMYVMYTIQRSDAEATRREIKQVYTDNVRKQMEDAKARGERIEMVTRYGEVVTSFDDKKRGR